VVQVKNPAAGDPLSISL